MLFLQLVIRADDLALFNAGSSIPARIAMIAITTRSSIKVKLYSFTCPWAGFVLSFTGVNVLLSLIICFPYKSEELSDQNLGIFINDATHLNEDISFVELDDVSYFIDTSKVISSIRDSLVKAWEAIKKFFFVYFTYFDVYIC